ncbi:interleukin-20-like [Pseudophryne corroboree]|uniref:interleukin-20-like n=1 Tax=Pseudophryne corroboree TaxID=495146 RepID=UPI003081537A
MKRDLLRVVSMIVMYFNAAMAGVLPSPTCDISPTMEDIIHIREIFDAMRSSVQQQDKYIHLQMLKTSSMQSIPPSERCCFLKHIIHFYVNKVFIHSDKLDTLHHITASKITNLFCALRNPKPCQFNIDCSCGDITMHELKSTKDIFEKLALKKAIIKAFGELDILIDWMKMLF